MEEIWKPVLGYEGHYEVSNLGRVKSLKHGKIKILKELNRHLYLSVNLSKNDIMRTENIHRLVAIHFVPNPHNKTHVNHIDLDKHNNKAENLEWVTVRENTVHYHLKKGCSTGELYIKKHYNNFQVRVTYLGKLVSLGSYKTLDEAILVRNNFLKSNNIENIYF